MTSRGRRRRDAVDESKSGDAGRHDGKHDVVPLGPGPAQCPRDVDHQRRRRGPEDDFVALTMQQIPQRATRLPQHVRRRHRVRVLPADVRAERELSRDGLDDRMMTLRARGAV